MKPEEILWGYLRMPVPAAEPVDILLVLGGHDEFICGSAADLFLSHLAEWIVVSGGRVHLPDGAEDAGFATEAAYLTAVLEKLGVDPSRILEEPFAINTSENFWLAAELLRDRELPLRSCILITKPYVERRALATGRRRWPTVEFHVQQDLLTYTQYLNRSGISETRVLSMMVGEVERIAAYGEQGLIEPQVIPADVWQAKQDLVDGGHVGRTLSA